VSVFGQDADAAPDAAQDDADAEQGDSGTPLCQVTSTTPVSTSGSSCGPESVFSFNGTTAQCGGIGCAALCPGSGVSCSIEPGFLTCFYSTCGLGRLPEGLELPGPPPGATSTGSLLAVMAQLEAASVHAFVHLARELRAHGAPDDLRSRALRASRDEVRHARVMTELARGRGVEAAKVRAKRRGVRSLERIAVENAVEGCVRETFGAALAMMQARTARDAGVRAAMARIARDEAQHAVLAWDIARWLDTQLTPEAQARVRRARSRAADAMVEASSGADEDAMRDLGLPEAEHAQALARRLRTSLWN
jgi:hypothetical protein